MYSRFPLYRDSFVDGVYDNVVDEDATDAADDDDCHYCLSGQEKPYRAARDTAPLGVRHLKS